MEKEVLLKLIKGESLSEEQLNTVRWEQVFDEATHQAVFALVYAAAKPYQSCWSGTLRQRLTNQYLALMARNIRAVQYQKDMMAVMVERPYPFAIIKGMASASYWPQAELRPFGDCDFLIDPAQLEELCALFQSKGYDLSGEANDHHVVLKKKDGADLEMHYDLGGMPVGMKEKETRACLTDMLCHLKLITLCDCTFPVPEPAYTGMILILHLQQHLTTSGIGLRHLLDLGYFVSRTKEESFWTEKLLPWLKASGLFVFAGMMVKTCAHYCGTDCPDWAEGADERICKAIMEDILAGGNFGQKNMARSKSCMMFASYRKSHRSKGRIANLYQTLHESTAGVYPIVREKKLLYPVMDGWRILKYWGRVIRGERPALIAMTAYADERQALYDQLKLFQ